MTKFEARQWKMRWRKVNDLLNRELRARKPDEDVQAFCAVMQTCEALGVDLGRRKTEEGGEEIIRKRWNRLRRQYLAGKRPRLRSD